MATGYKSSSDIGTAKTYDSNGFLFQRQSVGSGSYNNLYCVLLSGWGYGADGYYGNVSENRTSGSYYQRNIDGTYWERGTIVPFTYYTITTQNDPNGHGDVSASGGNGQYFDENTECTITAKPKYGYVVTSIDGTAVSPLSTGNKTKKFTVTSDKTVSAVFQPYYGLYIDDYGAVSLFCLSGESYTLPEPPSKTGYLFMGYSLSPNGQVSYQPGDTYSNSNFTPGQSVTLYSIWKQYTITYDSDGGSEVSPQSYYGYITLASAPTKAGYVFGGWEIDGTTYQPGATYNLTEDVTATAVWIGHKSIATSVLLPAGAPDQAISVSISPAATSGGWDEGTTITATAPASGVGIVFDSWSVSVASTDAANVTTFTMPDAAVSVTAIYRLAQINVAKEIDEASAVAVEEGDLIEMVDASTGEAFPDGEPVYGQTARFTAPEPLEGFAFSGWYNSDSSAVLSRERVITLELTQDISIVAKYSVQVSVAKDTTDGNGSFSVDGITHETQASVQITAELGSSHQITANPAGGYFFGGWVIDDSEEASDLFVDDAIVIDGAHTYTATFVSTKIEVSVTVSSAKNDSGEIGNTGTLLVQGEGVTVISEGASYTVDGFTEITLVAVPAASNPLPLFRIEEDVSGEDDPVLSKTSPVTVRISNTDRAFRAKWGNATQFHISVSSANIAQGIAFVGDSQNVTSIEAEQDSEVVVTALPANGYKFAGWYENGVLVEDAGSRYSFPATRQVSLVAHFGADAIAICAWEGSEEPKTLTWTSKVYTLPKPFDPVAARVDAVAYPVNINVETASKPDSMTVRDHERDLVHELPIVGQNGRRLQRRRPERFLQVTVTSEHEVDAIVVGTNMSEVN